MNRAAPSFKSGDSFQGIPVMHILYLLLILIAPFAGVNVLFLLSIAQFVRIRHSGTNFYSSRSVISHIYSKVLMILVSVITGGSSFTYPFYIVLAAFAVAAVGNHGIYFSETDHVPDFTTRRSRIIKSSFSTLWSSALLALRIAGRWVDPGWSLGLLT